MFLSHRVDLGWDRLHRLDWVIWEACGLGWVGMGWAFARDFFFQQLMMLLRCFVCVCMGGWDMIPFRLIREIEARYSLTC